MLNDFCGAKKVYLACGYTDLRRGIDGLATIVEQQFQLDSSFSSIPAQTPCSCFAAGEPTG